MNSDLVRDASSLSDVLKLRAQHTEGQWIFLKNRGREEVSISYQQLHQRAKVVAGALRAEGCQAGDRVIMLFRTGTAFLEGFFGCLYLGAVAVPLNPPRPNRSKARFHTVMDDCGSTLILTDEATIDSLKQRLPESTKALVVDSLRAEPLADEDCHPCQRHDLAFLQYTSGSTGTPKGVMITHGNLLANLEAIHSGGLFPDDVFVNWLPFFHDMGLIFTLLEPLYAGLLSVHLQPAEFMQRPATWLRAIHHYKGTICGGPNFAFEHCVNKATPELLEELDFSRWRAAFTGSEPISASTLQRFAETFAPTGFNMDQFYPCYGLAEATLFVTGGDQADPLNILHLCREGLSQHQVVVSPDPSRALAVIDCGIARPGFDLAIAEPTTGKRLADGEIGEVWLVGPSVAQGYWKRPELTKEIFQRQLDQDPNGPYYLATGDLGFVQADRVFITGRLKDLVIVRGKNYVPADIETTASQAHDHVHIDGCAAFSYEQDGRERLVIAQELQRGKSKNFDVDAIGEAIRLAVSEHYDLQLDSLLLLKPGSLPKTTSGKIQRKATQAAFLDGSLPRLAEWPRATAEPEATAAEPKESATTPSATLSHAQLEQWMAHMVAGHLGLRVDQVDVRQPLALYGLDSPTALSILGDLEHKLNRDLSPTLVYEFPTIRDLAAHLSDAANPELTIPNLDLQEPIAIVGMACRFPGANSPDEFWALLDQGRDAITEVPASRWNLEEHYDPEPGMPDKMITRWGGFLDQVDQFDAKIFNISDLEAENMDPQQRLLLESTWQAMEDSGFGTDFFRASNTGVFVGIGGSDYGNFHMVREGGRNAFAGLGCAASIAANRISWQFDLRGPSLALDTACSSALVALDRACKSIQQGECHTALVSAVNLIIIPEVTTALFQAGMMSPDGRCKAFDAEANGYVRSEGCASILLKPLAEAQRDGSTILGVIRGSAVNQDGRGNGMTAPNGRAQKEVLLTALRRAGLSGKDLDYVEAHGTGTALGDPIEMEALKSVLTPGRSQEQPCYIGSAKTNVGHTEITAGFVGLLKVLLAFREQRLPAHLHLNRLNPHIQLEDVPLAILTEPRAWPRSEQPCRAGVSSFGIGGTNAHVIVEEAPLTQPSATPAAEPCVLTLSADSADSLETAKTQLANKLTTLKGSSLSDVARTLNQGRRALPHRCAWPATTWQEAIQPTTVYQSKGTKAASRLVFMFPGQGSQFPAMGAPFYEQEPVYRATLDRCLTHLNKHLDIDLAALLQAEAHGDEQAATLLSNTRYAQPAIFAVSYALANVWLSRGLRPEVMIGHSVGEFVAACLAGVFELGKALELMVTRGRLMQSMPAGAMLAVPLSVAELQGDLGEDVDLAAVNGPNRCVASGSFAAIEVLQQRLAERKVAARPLVTSHAFHSRMMTPILDAFKDAVRQAAPQPPQRPFVSNLTGDLISAEQACDPDYWAEHLRNPMQFEKGMQTLADKTDVFLEVGPGRTLVILGRSILKKHPASRWLTTLGKATQAPSAQPIPNETLARLWVTGLNPQLETTLPDHWQRVSLPPLVMNRSRYWVESGGQHAKKASLARIGDPTRWFYLPCWQQAQPLPAPADLPATSLVFHDGSETANHLVHHLTTEGTRVLRIEPGPSFEVLDDQRLAVIPGSAESFGQLVDHLVQLGFQPDAVFHFWLHEQAPTRYEHDSFATHCLEHGMFSLIQFLQRWEGADQPCSFKLLIATREVCAVESTDRLVAEKATILGPAAVIGLEYPELASCHIDIGIHQRADQVVPNLLAEICQAQPHGSIALRGRKRWRRQFQLMPQPQQASTATLATHGVYLITGGLGGVGRAIALYLAKRVQAKLVLVSRSGLPEESEWPMLLKEGTDQSELQARIRAVQAMRQAGAQVRLETCDVTNPAALKAMVNRITQALGPINGVIHAAGIPGDGMIRFKTRDAAQAVLAPKVTGSLALEAAFADQPPEFMVFCSSIFVLEGEFGQVDYCAANAFLDALAEQNDRPRSRRLSINWGAWRDAGMAARMDVAPAFRELHERQLKMGLKQAEGGVAFGRALDSGQPLIAVATQDLQAVLAAHKSMDFSSQGNSALPTERRERSLDHPYEAPKTPEEETIANLIGEVTGVDQVGRTDSFFELGGDSLIAANLFTRLKDQFGFAPTIADFYNDPTVAGIATLIRLPQAVPTHPAVTRVSRDGDLPLSFAQHRLWFAAQTTSDGSVYNLPSDISISGPLDRDHLLASLVKVVQRHESLRTQIREQDGVPYQVIVPDVPVALPFTDMSTLAPEVQDKKLEWLRNEEAGLCFDLAQPPLFRLHLVKLAEQQHRLFFNIHHIVFDGMSEAILMNEWIANYQQPGQTLPALKLQYVDFAAAQRQQFQTHDSAQDDWWRQRVAEAPRLLLPVDHRGDRPSGHFEVTLEPALHERLKARVQREQSTVFSHLMAA